jgi:hypothetical protein
MALAGLCQKDFARLQVLKPVILKFGQVLYEPGQAIRQVCGLGDLCHQRLHVAI